MSNQPDHSSRGHAEFSPSSLKYVAGCRGYHGRDGTNAAAERGTRIHEALEGHDPSILHNEEELGLYDQIIEMEKAFMGNFDTLKEEHNEIQMDIKLDGTETWGTCDRFLVLKSGNKAVMADYKTGISIIDPPDKNWQAKAYVVGAFQRFVDIEEIVFVFYVPQHNASLHHTFKRADVDGIVDTLSKVIRQAEKIRPKWEKGTPSLDDLTPNVNCRFCRYEDSCPALGGLVMEVARKINPQLPDVDIEGTEDPEIVEQLWAIAKIVSNWADRFKKKAVALAKDGKEFPSLKLRSMGSSRRIMDNKSLLEVASEFGITAEEVLEHANIPLAKLAKAIGDTAEKGGKRKLSDNFVDACQAAGIVETSDPRYTLS
mgnify:CR=1 FL=1|tara:strand:+ start:2718 stop:3833 length:1116 start_codon:yes stop_codon:yes gene_type:complete